ERRPPLRHRRAGGAAAEGPGDGRARRRPELMTTLVTGARAAVWAALGTVRDPELDEPLTDLGFVARCEVSDAGHAVVRLRLPTYFCAPNFAFLMVAKLGAQKYVGSRSRTTA